MGIKDIAAKDYFSDTKYFADIFNYQIYGGKSVIDPHKLTKKDTAVYHQTKEKRRDLFRVWATQADSPVRYVLLGVEEQSYIDYAMPARTMILDAYSYDEQLREIRRKNRSESESRKDMSKDELLSGFRKGDKLVPVITVVLHLGTDPWDGPERLHEMLQTTDPEILNAVPDYPLNLISPGKMNDSEFRKFHTDFGKALEFIKYANDKRKLQEKVNTDIISVDTETAKLLNSVVDARIAIDEEKGEKINMCKAIEDIRLEGIEIGIERGIERGIEQGIERGIEQGYEKGRLEMLISLVKKGLLTIADASNQMEMTEEQFEKLLATN